MPRCLPRFPLVQALIFLSILAAITVSCGPGQPTYLDRVKALSEGRHHRLVKQLVPLLEKPEGRDRDDLMRSWRAFVGPEPLPLRQDNATTFVYYDFSKKLTQVYLEATFAPGRSEPLARVGATSLFVRTYDVPKPDRLRYRFTDGKVPLADPFDTEVAPGPDQWHEPALATTAAFHRIVAAAEPGLGTQDLTLLLPPSYTRNLARTYPLLVLVGLDGDGWSAAPARLMQDGLATPFVVVSVGTKAGGAWTAAELKALLEDRILPWVRNGYRISPLASDLVLVGWGPSAPVTQAVADARPDYWIKSWTPLADQAQGEQAWNTLAPPFLRAQFPVVRP